MDYPANLCFNPSIGYHCAYRLGMTRLHLAVVHNDLRLIEHLLRAGDNVNAKTSTGDTPLSLALKHNRVEAVQMLVNTSVIKCTHPEKSVTGLLEYSTQEMSKIIEYFKLGFLMNLISSNLSIKKVVEILVIANCPFEYVWLLKNNKVNREFITNNPLRDYQITVLLAVAQRDFETVRLIIHCGNKDASTVFCNILKGYLILIDEMELFDDFIERFLDWNVIGDNVLRTLNFTCRQTSLRYLETLLNWDTRSKLCQQVNSGEIDVNDQATLLDAVRTNLVKNVQFLLHLGANVNIKGENERTAIFGCIEWNCVESGRVLLEYGADVQANDDSGLCAFQLAKNKDSPLLESMIAQLAIDCVQGVPIKQENQCIIDSCEDYKKMYDEFCQQLRFFKTCQIVGSITLFNLLTEQVEKLYRTLRDQDCTSLLDDYKDKYNFHQHYYSTLKSKLITISTLYRFKCKLAYVIYKCTEQFVEFDHLVVREISKYLNRKDIYVFMKIL